MDETVLKFRVGIFVLFSFIILGVLIFLNVEGFKSQYTLFVKTESAPGVTKGTPIRRNGLLIGRVSNVTTTFDEQNRKFEVTVTLRVNRDESIYRNESVQFGTESILGDAVLEVISPPVGTELGELLQNEGSFDYYTIKESPLEIVDKVLDLAPQVSDTLAVIQEAATSIKQTSDGINGLSETVQTVFQDDDSEVKLLMADLRKLSTQADAALDNFSNVFENLNDIIADPELKDRFYTAMDGLPILFEEIRLTFATTSETVKSWQSVSQLAESNLANLEPFTASLKTEGPLIVSRINGSLSQIDVMVQDVAKFTKSIGNIGESKGTIGKLINSPELYQSVLKTAENVREVSDRLEPLMNDIRTFADQLARDPRQLGVRGMGDLRPLGTGYKASTTGRDRVIRY